VPMAVGGMRYWPPPGRSGLSQVDVRSEAATFLPAPASRSCGPERSENVIPPWSGGAKFFSVFPLERRGRFLASSE